MLTFEQLYRDHYPDVYRFASWLTRDRDEAEDVASETFVRAWARRDRLRTETLSAYLFAIARNIVLSGRRRQRTRHELNPALADGAPNPHRQAASRIELERVWQAMVDLPEPDRTALVLRTEHSLPYAEIARVLEISEGAARVRVHRARRRLLADALNRFGGEP